MLTGSALLDVLRLAMMFGCYHRHEEWNSS